MLTSRNVRGSRFVDFLLGGLNYQIEHHLFPNMPRPNLRHAQPLVRAFCRQHHLPYTESTLFGSYTRPCATSTPSAPSARHGKTSVAADHGGSVSLLER